MEVLQVAVVLLLQLSRSHYPLYPISYCTTLSLQFLVYPISYCTTLSLQFLVYPIR